MKQEFELHGRGRIRRPTTRQCLALALANGGLDWFVAPKKVSEVGPLATGLMLDLDARYGVTLAGSDVASWADQAGAANNFAEAANSPVYTASDANWGNRPSIAWASASDDRLVSADAASTWTFLHNGSGGTVAMLIRPNTASGATLLRLFSTSLDLSAGTGFNVGRTPDDSAIRFRIVNGTTGTSVVAAGAAPNLTRRSIVATFSNTLSPKMAIYSNGVLANSTSTVVTPSAAAPNFTAWLGSISGGTTFDYNGDIVSVHVWNRYFTAADAALYHQWAIANWGL